MLSSLDIQAGNEEMSMVVDMTTSGACSGHGIASFIDTMQTKDLYQYTPCFLQHLQAV